MLEDLKTDIQNAGDIDLLSKKWGIQYLTQDHQDYLWRFYPATQKYYFEANPSFLFEYRSLDNMQMYPLIMLRDGIIPLTYFFMQNIQPPSNFKTKILIPRKYMGIVPKKWRELVYTYELDYLEAKITPEKLYVTGHANNYTFWKEEEKETIGNLRKKIHKDTKVEFLIPNRERSVFPHFDESGHVNTLLKEIYQHFGFETKIHTENDKIPLLRLTKSASFCELNNSDYIIHDNFLSHKMATRGLTHLDKINIDKKDCLEYPLSFNHSIVLKEVDFSENYFNEVAFYMKVHKIRLNFFDPNLHNAMKDLIKDGVIK